MLKARKKKKKVCYKCGMKLKKYQFIDCAYYTCIQMISTSGVLNGRR